MNDSTDFAPASRAIRDVDALIVGAGVMGAIVAAQIRAADPAHRILMVDAGSPMGALGHHLHDNPDIDARRDFAARADTANQEKYVRGGADAGAAAPAAPFPGMHPLADFGHDTTAMPGASVGWNVGGMSVHWAGAAPTPYGAEIPSAIERSEWDDDLRTAQHLLRVHADPYPRDVVGEAVLEVVDEVFGGASAPGRHPQAMPVAIQPGASGGMHRTGPSAIFPPIEFGGDASFTLQHSTLVTRVLIEDGRAIGAALRGIDGGDAETVRAAVVIVCADTFRTPQLLFASGIGGQAVGCYLNEHAFLAGTVLVDVARLGVAAPPSPLAGEWFTSSSWLPHSDAAQPFQGQIMQAPVAGANGGRDGYAATLAFYVPTDVRRVNRIRFSKDDVDRVGMPRMTVDFGYSDRDLALIERAREDQARLAARLGDFDPQQPPTLLPAGSSLHYTGTARLGLEGDGTSVCDPEGRVWGVHGVLVAGNAVVPTALVANSTLAGAVTAVRAGRAAAALLAE